MSLYIDVKLYIVVYNIGIWTFWELIGI